MKRIFSKNSIRAIVFLCITVLLIAGCSKVFGFADPDRTNTVLDQFYELEDNTVECDFFGSSVAQRAYVTPVAYHDYGVPAYTLATGTQPFVLTKYLMKEALKTQTPKLFVVELKGVNKSADWVGDIHIRRVVDNMKPSLNRFQAIRSAITFVPEGANDVDSTGLSYYFPIIKYHSRWNPSKRIKAYEDVDYYNGWSPNAGYTFKVKKITPVPYDDHTQQIDPPTEEVLVDLLDYCDTLTDTKVLFVMPPYQASEEGIGKMNYAKNIVESRGYEVLNMLPAEAREGIGLNDNSCYYNREHLNYYGSLIYTEFFFNYIKEHYGIEDQRDKPGHEAWEKEYDRLMSDLETKYQVRYIDMMADVNKAERGDK